MKHHKTTNTITRVIVLLLLASTAPIASAQNCKSAGQVVGDIWKKWGETIIKVGCVTKAVVETAASGGASLPASVALSAQCIRNATKYKVAAESMVTLFNALADNGPATIGPRRIEFGTRQNGTLLGRIDRTFISVYPMDKASVTFKLKKLDGEGTIQAVICKVDSDGKYTNLATIDFDDKAANGKEIIKTVSGVENHLVQIRLDGQTALRKFQYELQVSK
jgi:hypothetical protein